LRPLHFLAIPPSLFAKVIANLKTDESHPVYEYHPGSWGPLEADRLLAHRVRWHVPRPAASAG
jgi:glucose-6-phosphate 1-dehydrogenase